MVVPLIIGASRVVAGGSKVLQRTQRKGRGNSKSRGEVSKKLRNSSRNEETTNSYRPQTKAQISKNIIDQARIDLLDDVKQMSEKEVENFFRFMEENLQSIQENSGKGGILPSALHAYKTYKAARVSWFIFATAISFSVPQIQFWIFSLIGMGVESIPFASWVLPGETLFMLSYVVVMAIGITTMIYAVLIYTMSLVNCFGRFKFLIFALCVAFYCTPILNGIPWFVLWLYVVTKNQGKVEGTN